MFCIDTSSHSPLCFLLLGPLTPSLTLLKAFRASSSSFRNMALVFPSQDNFSKFSSSLFHRDTPLKTREPPQSDSNRPTSPSFIFSYYDVFKMAPSAAWNEKLIKQWCTVLKWLPDLKTLSSLAHVSPSCPVPVFPQFSLTLTANFSSLFRVLPSTTPPAILYFPFAPPFRACPPVIAGD